MQAAHKLQAELWYDLPESERTEPAKAVLEQYLAASDLHSLVHSFTGSERLLYVRKRATDFYEQHYYQKHHNWPESIRFRSLIEQALLDTMGCTPLDKIELGFWHGVRLSGAIYQSNNRN
jgi:hypothetical protein